MTDRTRIQQSFVARIWLERRTDGDPLWRGHVQHIQGQEESYFQDLAELGAFLEEVSGVATPGLGAGTANDQRIPNGGTPAGRKRKADKRRDN